MKIQTQRRARKYNQRQRFARKDVVKIQTVVRATPNGAWDLATVRAVAAWQEANGIPPDGKVWKNARGNTWPVIQRAFDARTPTTLKTLGVWCDNSARDALKADYANTLAKLGFNSVTLAVNSSNTLSSNPGWRLRWSVATFEKVASSLRKKGIGVVLMAWPRPSQHVLDSMRDDLPDLMARTGASALQVDVEGNWKSRFLDRRQFSSMSKAAGALVDTMHAIADPLGAKLELTSYPNHSEMSASAVVSPHMDVMIPQAYSRYKPGNRDYAWSGKYGPGKSQLYGLERARVACKDNAALACGLAAYSQKGWPGKSPHQAMQKALDTAVAANVTDVRYWSSKFFYGVRTNAYAGSFVKEAMLTP